jgi:hypothetical protein
MVIDSVEPPGKPAVANTKSYTRLERGSFLAKTADELKIPIPKSRLPRPAASFVTVSRQTPATDAIDGP